MLVKIITIMVLFCFNLLAMVLCCVICIVMRLLCHTRHSSVNPWKSPLG